MSNIVQNWPKIVLKLFKMVSKKDLKRVKNGLKVAHLLCWDILYVDFGKKPTLDSLRPSSHFGGYRLRELHQSKCLHEKFTLDAS